MMTKTKKEKYQQFCEQEQLPLFSQYWWLDAVAMNGSWDVALIEKNGEVIASMPYYLTKKGLFTCITMPPLTQTMGPYIKYPDEQKYAKKLSYEKEMMNGLIDQLPKVDYFCQNFHHSVTNWLPFYWRGFSQTTRYTYVNSNSQTLEAFQSNIKTDIKKAEKKVQVQSVDSIDEIWHCLVKTFERQKQSPPYKKILLEQLDQQASNRNASIKLVAMDKENNIHAAVYLINVNSTIYYLIGGGDPNYRNSGATSLLIFEGLKIAKEQNASFDFEGSMIEPIERFFRAFGSSQTPYFQVKHVNSTLLKCREFFQHLKS